MYQGLYIGSLNGNKIRIVVTSYPPEGAAISGDDTNPSNPGQTWQTFSFTIPPGTAPFVQNVTCVACYATSALPAVTLTYTSGGDAAYTIPLDTTLNVDSVGIMLGIMGVTVSGLTTGEQYTIIATCGQETWQLIFVATSTTTTATGTVQPQTCTQYTRYVFVYSSDGVHAAYKAV